MVARVHLHLEAERVTVSCLVTWWSITVDLVIPSLLETGLEHVLQMAGAAPCPLAHVGVFHNVKYSFVCLNHVDFPVQHMLFIQGQSKPAGRNVLLIQQIARDLYMHY